MAIHNTLLEQFNEELGNPANFAVESRVRAITSARCFVPSDRPALQDVSLTQLLNSILTKGVQTALPAHIEAVSARKCFDRRRCC